MPNRQYEAGDRFEKRVMNDLTKRGFVCWQTRGSKSAADIVALTKLDVALVQVKSGEKTMDHADWNKLVDIASSVRAAPLVADRDGRNIRYRLITGYHTYRSRDWPAEVYEP